MNTLRVSNSEPPLRQRSRWYQFRVRTLLLLMALVAIGLGIGVRSWRRHQALEMIRHEMQGGVGYSYGGVTINGPETEPGPRWLRDALGEDLFNDTFCDVTALFVGDFTIRPFLPRRSKDARSSIDDTGLRRLREVLPLFDDLEYLAVMTSSKVTDAGLEHLAGVRQLQQFDASASRVTSVGLRHLATAELRNLNLRGTSLGDDLTCLAAFQQLQILDLGETDVSDEELEHLASLSNLERLCLDSTRISDEGLKHLRGLESLDFLLLSSTQITDRAFRHLKDLPALRILIANDTQIVGSGLKRCLQFQTLEELNISNTTVSDEFVARLKGQSSLGYLDLSDTEVTDAGLVHLMDMKRLVWLSLERTKVTDGGVEELQQAFPDCRIDF